MINWKVRIRNKLWWLAFIPAVLVLICEVAAVFGYTIELTALGNRLAAVVEAVFALLALLGVVTDPTTEGVADSKLAMTYKEPKPKGQ